jgi:hypothetical protein
VFEPGTQDWQFLAQLPGQLRVRCAYGYMNFAGAFGETQFHAVLPARYVKAYIPYRSGNGPGRRRRFPNRLRSFHPLGMRGNLGANGLGGSVWRCNRSCGRIGLSGRLRRRFSGALVVFRGGRFICCNRGGCFLRSRGPLGFFGRLCGIRRLRRQLRQECDLADALSGLGGR